MVATGNNERTVLPEKNPVIPTTGLGFGLLLIVMSGAGFLAYGLGFLDSLKFFLAIFALFYIPGSLLIRSIGFKADNFMTLPVLALAAGTVLVPAMYKFLRFLNYSDSYAVGLFVLCAAAWIYLVRGRLVGGNSHLQPRQPDLFGGLAILVIILLLLHFSHFTDVSLNSDSFLFRANDMTESVFHLGLVNALADGYPPPSLYASAETDFSAYHMNMHLQADLLSRWLGIESLNVVSFYLPFFYFSLLVLLPYVFVREIGGSVLTAFFCAILIFGSDFSFIPSILLDTRPGFAWTAFFHTTIWALFTLNGYLPSLIALFLSIMVLRDYFSHPRLAKLVLFALLAFGAFGFKSPMGLQIGAAALGTGLVMAFFSNQRTQGWSLAAVSLSSLAVMYLDLTMVRSGVGHAVVRLEPLIGFHGALDKLGLSNLSIDWYLPMIIVLLVAGLGIRTVGLWFLGTLIKRDGLRNWNLVFLGLMFLSGYVISELFFIGSPNGQNNAGWFYIQSLMACWFLLFMFLVSIEDRKTVYIATIIAFFLLASPSTIQFLSLRSSDDYVEFSQDDLRIIEHLRESDRRSVVIHPLNHDRPSLASNFAGRSTVLSVWVSFVTDSSGLYERADDVMLFFNEESNSSQRKAILEKYGVDYVLGSEPELTFMEKFPGAILELKSGDQMLYRVRGPD